MRCTPARTGVASPPYCSTAWTALNPHDEPWYQRNGQPSRSRPIQTAGFHRRRHAHGRARYQHHDPGTTQHSIRGSARARVLTTLYRRGFPGSASAESTGPASATWLDAVGLARHLPRADGVPDPAREDTQARSARVNASPRAGESYPGSLAGRACVLSSMIWIGRSLIRRAYAS